MNAAIEVLCPTRGRGDDQLWEVVESFNKTRRGQSTLTFIVDADDQTPHEYDLERGWIWRLPVSPGSMGAALNFATEYTIENIPSAPILGFIGDDHRFRSDGWDIDILEALKDGGIAYGDDGVQGEALATQWFMSAEVYRTLGWMALPNCRHFYLDNAVMDIGNAAGCLKYLPRVRIEHMHFSYGKSEMDDTYMHTMRVGSGDEHAYRLWRSSDVFDLQVKGVKEALR